MVTTPHSVQSHLSDGLAYWHRIRGTRPMPSRTDVDPLDIPQLLPYVMLIDVLREPLDFRFRLLGTGHDQIVARDYKGMRFSDLPHLARGNPVWGQYERVTLERTPLRASIPYIGADTSVRKIEHYLLPLSTDGETVDMIFVVTAVDRT